MPTMNTKYHATAFRSMHRGDLLVLPNAWDAMSACVFAQAGCKAIATTSAGVAWSLGYPDGEQVPWEEFLAATRRIARSLKVPLTVDLESGFGRTQRQLQERIRAVIATGAAGINLEDSRAHELLPLVDAAARVSWARQAAEREGVPIVINARTDLYLHGPPGNAVSFADVLQRCRAYLAAGADCVYPIGLAEVAVIGQLVRELRAPVNVMGRPGAPTLSELRTAGVARVSIAVSAALHVAGVLLEDVARLQQSGSFEHFASTFQYQGMQKLFAGAQAASGGAEPDASPRPAADSPDSGR